MLSLSNFLQNISFAGLQPHTGNAGHNILLSCSVHRVVSLDKAKPKEKNMLWVTLP